MKHAVVTRSYDLSMEIELSSAAALLAERARAAMLVALLDGRALPAGELARAAGVSAQSASGHLNLLREQNMLQVEQQGRHRYYRLHRPEVAQAIEALAALVPQPRAQFRRGQADPAICFARHCYSHLAGRLAVEILDRIEEEGFLRPRGEKLFTVTRRGRDWFESVGIDAALWHSEPGKLACRCLDWTERKHHLAGRLGVAFFHCVVGAGWLKRTRDSRAMRVTDAGRVELERRLGILISRNS